MRSQLVLFEVENVEAHTTAVWEHLNPTQQEKAVQQLAELMVRTVATDDGQQGELGGKEKSDEQHK